MRYVKAVEPLEPYKLRVTFDNDEIKIIDMSGFLHRKIYMPLRNFEFFKKCGWMRIWTPLSGKTAPIFVRMFYMNWGKKFLKIKTRKLLQLKS